MEINKIYLKFQLSTYCDTVSMKNSVFYTRKNELKFLLTFSLHLLQPGFKQVNVECLTVSCFCFGAIHGREIHQGLLKMKHFLWLRKPLRCKLWLLGEYFGEISLCVFSILILFCSHLPSDTAENRVLG